MVRFIMAWKAFWSILTGRVPAERAQALLVSPLPEPSTHTAPVDEVRAKRSGKTSSLPAESAASGRSAAITLLATLQREARLVDLVMEPLEEYTDEQIGAAARDVLKKCRQVLDRTLALQPVIAQSEGATVPIDDDYDVGRIRLVGSLDEQPPASGTLVHPGWQARRVQLADWSGQPDSALVVAPAELQCGPVSPSDLTQSE